MSSDKKERLFKTRIYAWYQFASLLAMSIIFTTLVVYGIGLSTFDYKTEGFFGFILHAFESIGSESTTHEEHGVISLVWFIIGGVTWVASWVIALQILRIRRRNLLDELFLLFFMFPLISNVLCLLTQSSSRTIELPEAKLNEKKIIDGKISQLVVQATREIEIHKKDVKKVIEKNKEFIKTREKRREEKHAKKVESKKTKK